MNLDSIMNKLVAAMLIMGYKISEFISANAKLPSLSKVWYTGDAKTRYEQA